MFPLLVVLATSIWMAVDAARLDYDPRDVRGLAAMSPVGWLISGLLLWIVAFPLYLLKRPMLKAAGERRRWALAAGQHPHYFPAPGSDTAQGPQGYPHPGQPYPGHPHPGQPYPGQPYSGQPYLGQPYLGQPQPGRPYPGQPYPGQPYPDQSPWPTTALHDVAAPRHGRQPADDATSGTARLTMDEVADAIVRLSQLREAGLLTDEEFEAQKQRVLARMG